MSASNRELYEKERDRQIQEIQEKYDAVEKKYGKPVDQILLEQKEELDLLKNKIKTYLEHIKSTGVSTSQLNFLTNATPASSNVKLEVMQNVSNQNRK